MKIDLFIPLFLYTSVSMAQKADSLPSRVYNWDNLKVIKGGGQVRKDIMEGSTTALAWFEVHASTLEQGKAPHPARSHTGEEELIIVKEGRVAITINGISKIAGPWSIAYFMPGDEYGIENAGNTAATYYVFKYKSKLPLNLERAKQNGGSFMINWDTVTVTKTDKGRRRQFFNKATSQLAKFEMHTTALNAGFDSHPPHTHKEEEIILILRGHVQMNISGNFYRAGPGDVVFLSSGVSHNLANTGNEQCEYFAFQWRN